MPAACDALVIGGGPAGAAFATHVARAGARVCVVERERTATHKVCGEFLSREVLVHLRVLGIDLDALNAPSIDRVRITSGSRAAESPLPFPARSLTRRALDASLLSVAAGAGADIHRGASVERLEHRGDLWHATLQSGETFSAPAVFLATGKHDLRGRPRPSGRQTGLIAFKMYFRLAPRQQQALDGIVELILYRGGYAGLQLVEDGLANLCCLVDQPLLKQCGSWPRLLSHLQEVNRPLAERLAGAQPMLDKPLALSSIPYGHICAPADVEPGLFPLGDQAAVIPSFTGDGMAIALETAHLASQAFLTGTTSAAYARSIANRFSRQVRLATVLSRAVVARPKLMAIAAQMFPAALGLIAERTRIAPAASA